MKLSDVEWEAIKRALPPPRQKKKTGRPRLDDRQAMEAILYQQQSGCPWKRLPRHFGASSTIYDRWKEWQQAGVFDQLPEMHTQDHINGSIPPPPFDVY